MSCSRLLDRFQKRISVDGRKRSENYTKTLVWMQIFCSVFIKWKRCVFKNALVWFRLKLNHMLSNYLTLAPFKGQRSKHKQRKWWRARRSNRRKEVEPDNSSGTETETATDTECTWTTCRNTCNRNKTYRFCKDGSIQPQLVKRQVKLAPQVRLTN